MPPELAPAPATWKKICVDAVSPDVEGPALAAALHLGWQADADGEGGLRDTHGRYVVWVNAVPDAGDKTDRVRLDVGPEPPYLRAIVVESSDAEQLAGWWADVLGVPAPRAGDGRWHLDVPGAPAALSFLPGRPDPAPSRAHWDLTVPALPLLLRAGARLVRPIGGDLAWDVVADPEGNLFCAFPG